MTGNGLPRCGATDRWVMGLGRSYEDIPCEDVPTYRVNNRYDRCERHRNDVPRNSP